MSNPSTVMEDTSSLASTVSTESTTFAEDTSESHSTTESESTTKNENVDTTGSSSLLVSDSNTASSAVGSVSTTSTTKTSTDVSSTDITFADSSEISNSTTADTTGSSISFNSTVSPSAYTNISDTVSTTWVNELKTTHTAGALANDPRDNYVYIFTGTSAALVVVITLIVVILNSVKRRHRTTLKTKVRDTSPEDGGASQVTLASQRGRDPSDNYWEVDLEDNETDTRMSPYPQKHDPDPEILRTSGGRASESHPACLTSFGLIDGVGTERSTKQTPPPNNVYFILEPRKSGGGGGDTRAKSEHILDDTARDSNPYYSEIQDLVNPQQSCDGRQNTQKSKPRERCFSSTFPKRSVSAHHYELVDLGQINCLSSELRSQLQCGKSDKTMQKEAVSKLDSVTVSSSADPDDEELVLRENSAYQSAEEVLTQLSNNKLDSSGESEEEDAPNMVDNIAYQPLGDILPAPPQSANDKDEDEVVPNMVDNIAYQSVGEILPAPAQTADDKDGTVGDDDSDEITMVDNVTYQSVDEVFA